MGFSFGDGNVIFRLSSNGLLTLDHAKHDVEPAPIIIVPEPLDEVEPSTLAPDKLCSLTAADQADTMSTGDEEQSLGLNGRLRPRKSLVASPLTTKVSRKSDGKSPSSRPKRNTSTSNTSPTKLDDLANKSDSFSTPQILCAYCDKKFASKQNVMKHVRRLHMVGTKHESNISCLFCNHAEADFEIIRHMVDSHPNQYFACLDCHSRFNSTAELAEHKLGVCERQKPNYNTKPRKKNGAKKNRNSLKIGENEDFRDDSQEFSTGHGFNGIVISCELKPSQVSDDADIEDNITTNLILPHTKSLGANTGIEKNAVIVLDDLQWNKRIPPNFSFQNTDADQILSRLGVVHRSPRTADASRRDWYKLDEAMQKFEKCFDTSFYSKVASNVQENLTKFLDGSFNFNPDPDSMIKTRKSKNSVVINTAEGFPILLASEQFSRNVFDGYMPRAIAPKHKWKWENQENDRSAMNPDQIKRDAHTNNCIITLISSLDIWTQLSMRKKFEDKFNISPPEKKTEKQLTLGKELKEILESRELPASSSQIVQYTNTPPTDVETNDFPASLGLKRAEKPIELKPAVLSGESVRPRCYVCCACGAQAQDSKALSSHITTQHPNAQVQHYEVVGELLLNADIFKHLYVPPSQTVNRTRPLRGIRDCTKCKKSVTLEDLHQHMLDCAGDTPAVRRKCRNHRPFGVRRRRPRLPDNTIRKKMRKDLRTRQIRPKTRIRSRPKIRSEVGDAETIRKMIADLPAKRHRSSVTPTNLILRPSKRSNIQRNKFLIKRRSSEEHKSRRLRSSRQASNANLPSTSGVAHRDLDPDDEDNKPLKPRAITNKTTRINEAVKRNTKINRTKRKSLRTKEKSNSSIETLSDAPSASDKPTDSLSSGQSVQKEDVNNAPYNMREHSNRGGNNNRDNQRAGGSRRNDSPNNAAPPPNMPLKHSIARLTADSERHDKSVQFHHLFLVQQEYNHVNSTVQHGHTHQPVFFENEAAVTKLDKPPLPDVLKNVSDLQKCKPTNKPRKGLNDCIAMLKNKLVDPIPSATHVSVLCGDDDPIDQYVNEQIAPIMSSPIYDKPNGIAETAYKSFETNFTKPLDPPTVPSPVAFSPALPPQAKSLRNERTLRYHRKSLPEREVIPKTKRSTRRNTFSETNLENQITLEPIPLKSKNVLPKSTIAKELPLISSLDIKLPRDSSLDIIPLPVKVTRKKQSIPLNIESEKVKKNEAKRNEVQNNFANDFSTTTRSNYQRDVTMVTCVDNLSEVAPKTVQEKTGIILSKHSDDQSTIKVTEALPTEASSSIQLTKVTKSGKVSTEIPQAYSNANLESRSTVALQNTTTDVSKFTDHPDDQCLVQSNTLALATSPILPTQAANFAKISAEIPQAHSNVSVESILAVPLDLSGKVTKIKIVQLPIIQPTLDGDEETDNETLDLSKKTQDLTETDIIVDLSKKPATHDKQSSPKKSSDVHEEIRDLSCNKAIHLYTPTDLSIRGKQQATVNKIVDYEKLPKLSNYIMPIRQSDIATEAISAPENVLSVAADCIQTKMADTASPGNERRSERIENLTSRIESANDFSRHTRRPSIETSSDRQFLPPPNRNESGSPIIAVIDSRPIINNADSAVYSVNDVKMSKHDSAESKHINSNRSNQSLSKSDHSDRALLQESNNITGSNKINKIKIPVKTSPDSKVLQLKHPVEENYISKTDLTSLNKTLEQSTSKEEIEEQKLKNQSSSTTDIDLTEESVESTQESKVSLEKEHYLASTLQKPVYDPTLKIPQYKIRVTSSNNSSSDTLNYAPFASSQKLITSLANDSHNRLTENLACSRPNSLQDSTVLNSPYTPGDRSLYGFANGPLNSLEPLPAYTIHNRTLGLPSTKHESTKPVYTLANACISVTKIDPSNSATLTNTLLSIPGSTIASTMPVYTLTDTTIGVRMDHRSVPGQGPQANFETVQSYAATNSIVARDITTMSSQAKSINSKEPGKDYQENVDIAAESKPVSISNTTDPETARKIAMLPKELVDILGTMPIDHRNQLLNVLPQYVSTLTTNISEPAEVQTNTVTSVTLSPIQAECTRRSSISESDIVLTARDRKPSMFYEHPSSILSYPNSMQNVEFSKESLDKTENPNKFKIKTMSLDKVIDLTEEDSLQSTPDGFKPIEELSRNIFNTPQQNIDQDSNKVTQKGTNEKTSSLRAVRIKPQIERNKSIALIVQPTKIDILEKCVAESIDTNEVNNSTSSILAIQQAEVTSTQHKNNLKPNNETVNITPPPTTPSPDPNDVCRVQEERNSSKTKPLQKTFIRDEKIDNDKVEHEFVSISDNEITAVKFLERSQNILTKSDEEDSDDDVSLAIIVKQKQDQQKVLETESLKKKSTGQGGNKKKEKKIKDKKSTLPHSKAKPCLLQDDPEVTTDVNNIDNIVQEKMPCENKEAKSVFVNLEENSEENRKNSKRKKTRRSIGTTLNDCETLQIQKCVQDELDINKENKDNEGQQNCNSNEINVCDDTKKDNYFDQECKKVILRAEHDKYDNEVIGANEMKPNSEDNTSTDISSTSDTKALEDKKHRPKHTKSSKLKINTPEEHNEDEIFVKSDKSISLVSNKQPTESQDNDAVLDSSVSENIRIELNKEETNAATNIGQSDNNSGLSSLDTSEKQLSVSVPLRRSRRGKSMVDLINYQDEDNSNNEIEHSIPIPKKQLIFTKFLQDEENLEKNTCLPDKNVSKNTTSSETLVSPLIQDTPSLLDVSKKQPIEKISKTKPAKRKQSPQVKRKPKKKKSLDNSFVSQDERDVDNLTDLDLEPRPLCEDQVNLSKVSDVDMEISDGDSYFLKSAETSIGSINRLNIDSSNTSSAEKRKIIENSSSIPTSQTSQPKKCKLSEKTKSIEIKRSDEESKLNDSELDAVPENRTACYNMPVAIRRTRSKSTVVNVSSEQYDPYDIDQDEMIDIAEPKKCIHQSNKNNKNKSQESSKKKHFKRTKKSVSPSPVKNVQNSEVVKPVAIPKINLETKDVTDHEIESDDSSKSDVPLKQLVKEKEEKWSAIHKGIAAADAKIENIVEKRCDVQSTKKESILANKNSEIKQLETDEQLRSEQFMESFGFFSERKPRKSNLLASKKISETFHIIANENDDVYFGLKDKAIKKSLNENIKKCHEVHLKCDNNLHKKAAKRGRKKKCSTKPTTCYCCTCKKEFRRPDNYLRHQMTLLHVSKLSEIELKLDTVPVAEEPNYLIAFKQHIDKLKVLNNKISRDPKSLRSRHKIIMPTLDEILADVNKTVRDQQLSKRGLSNDEALFLDCCELLKESHNPEYASQEPGATANSSNNNTSEPRTATHTTFGNLDMLGKSFPKHKVCDTKSDGDVDSITAKTILESEEVRNLENDLISGLKEAACSSHNYHGDAVRNRTSDGNSDVFSSPNERDSHYDLDESDDNGNVTPNNDEFYEYPVYKEKMYPDIEEIDMFEDKFDKIKRKCRSQAAAANKNQVTVEPSASVKSRRKSKSEKKKAKKSSKKIHKSMVLTKAALKGFDGIKVSIPTSDINMSAIVPAESTGKKKKRTGSKMNRNNFNSESRSKPDNDDRNKNSLSTQAQRDVYEFMDNEDAELFELRPSTLMERFKRDKDTPSTAHSKSPRNEKDAKKHTDKDKHKDSDKTKKDKDTDKDGKDKGAEKDKKGKESDKTKKDKDNYKDKKDKDTTDKEKAENSSDDNDDFVYMSDDYRGSDHETENSQMSCETASGKVSNERKKTSSQSKRKDAAEKNAVMGKIFKNNAVRSDKKSPKAKETAKQKANLDQLFDSLLQEEPSTSPANTEEQTSKVENAEKPDENLDSIQDDIKSLISDDLSDSSHHLDNPSTSTLYRSVASNERNEATRIDEPVPFDIYGPSTSKAYDEFLYGPSTSKQFDILPSKDYKSKYDLSKNSAKHQSGSSPEYNVTSSSEDSDSPKKKKKQKNSKERTNRVNDGASTSFDFDSILDPDIPRQRERRKCTVGKQNVLAETWSSESEPDGVPRRPRSAESVLSGVARKKKGKKKEGHHGRRGKNKKQESERRNTSGRSTSGGYEEDGIVSSVRTSGGCPAPASAVPPIVPVAGPSGLARSIVPVAGPSGVSRPIVPVAGPSGLSRQSVAGPSAPAAGTSGVVRPRARAASFWSSEGEDEHVQQHGWIVGDSHKKLVTMLAHAKGRKRNTDDKRHFE